MTISVLIEKSARSLCVLRAGVALHRYAAVIGRNAGVDKEIEGDLATPLGEFYVCARNPRSRFFLSLGLSYPNLEDAERGLAARLIDQDQYAQIAAAMRTRTRPPQTTALGGEIYIHGFGDQVRHHTRGCIAIANPDMQQLYDLAVLGTPVRILP